MSRHMSNTFLEFPGISWNFRGTLVNVDIHILFIWSFLKGFCVKLIGTCVNCKNRKMFDSCRPLDASPIKSRGLVISWKRLVIILFVLYGWQNIMVILAETMSLLHPHPDLFGHLEPSHLKLNQFWPFLKMVYFFPSKKNFVWTSIKMKHPPGWTKGGGHISAAD